MKKKIAIILSHTQIHQLEEPTAPTAELEEFSDYDHLEEKPELESTIPKTKELETVSDYDHLEEPVLENPKPKFVAPTSMISWDGDPIQKNKIFNRCADNGIITKKDATGLEEKLIILDSIIPKIIVDQCVASTKLLETIKRWGYDGLCLGKDSPEGEVFRVAGGKNTILVTEVGEFYEKICDYTIYHVPIFVSRDSDMINQNVGKIIAHMHLFEKIIKYQ